MFLTANDTIDYNIDISVEEIVKQYELKYGEIKLTNNDLNLPLNDFCKERLPFSKTKKIILDYRNFVLAKKVEESKYNKIIILYGSLHKKGFYKELKKMNQKWGKK